MLRPWACRWRPPAFLPGMESGDCQDLLGGARHWVNFVEDLVAKFGDDVKSLSILTSV